MDLVAAHCENLAKADVDGVMLGWSLGGYPSLNLELAQRFAVRPAPDREAALQELAERRFGGAAAPHVRKAWTKFSDAFREFPFHIEVVYNGPQHCGPANLLFERPTGYRATMVGIPYDDLNGWRGPYPPEVFVSQFAKLAEGWDAGVMELELAQGKLEAEQRSLARADLRVAQAARLHFASVANQSRFVMARDAFLAAKDRSSQTELRLPLDRLLEGEIDLARRLYDLSTSDSRLGYEASNHYFYMPLDLVEKVVNCEYLRSRFVTDAASSSSQ
jgi:hypothetical protein